MHEEKIGTVIKFLGQKGVAIIKLDCPLSVGDKIHIRNDEKGIDFEQTIQKMQVDHEDVKTADKEVGIVLKERVKAGQVVLKIIEQ